MHIIIIDKLKITQQNKNIFKRSAYQIHEIHKADSISFLFYLGWGFGIEGVLIEIRIR